VNLDGLQKKDNWLGRSSLERRRRMKRIRKKRGRGKRYQCDSLQGGRKTFLAERKKKQPDDGGDWILTRKRRTLRGRRWFKTIGGLRE